MANILMMVVLLVGSAMSHSDPRIYTFGIGPFYPPFLAPSSTPQQTGFLKDIITKVCETAHKYCEVVSYNNFRYCWDTEKMLSEGLNNRYWDVCVGWYKTPERALVYSFFGEHNEEERSFLYASDSTTFQTYDPESHVTGFREAFWISSACIKNVFGTEVKNKRLYPSTDAIISAIKSGEISVGFINEINVKGVTGLREVSEQIRCAKTGHAMMVRKEDLPDFKWFDETLKDVIKSPFYKWICNIAKLGYGGDAYCLK